MYSSCSEYQHMIFPWALLFSAYRIPEFSLFSTYLPSILSDYSSVEI